MIKNNPNFSFDNARMESFFANLKKELLYRIPTYRMKRSEVTTLIFRYVFIYYNQKRVYTSNQAVFRLWFTENWQHRFYSLKILWVLPTKQTLTFPDFVIAISEQHTVRDFTEKAFSVNGIELRWEGTGIEEKGYDAANGKMVVCVNPQWFRPTDVDNLWGNQTKAKTLLGWNPQKTSYEELIRIMAEHDRKLAKREKAILGAE